MRGPWLIEYNCLLQSTAPPPPSAAHAASRAGMCGMDQVRIVAPVTLRSQFRTSEQKGKPLKEEAPKGCSTCLTNKNLLKKVCGRQRALAAGRRTATGKRRDRSRRSRDRPCDRMRMRVC
eukprot:793961-Pleurochrysis_carterae.AAC.2